ncbi:MAG TPA: LysM domain-containing protein [Burkholderiales bacterium]|nr:LysM domain-containing protein [Burkholderiales bacterium]
MRKVIISLILLLTPLAPARAAEASALKDDAPERYVVVPGDTLWSIAGRFLKSPWRWPEVWKMNQEQIKNPHRIYPGDVIVLDRTAADPQLRLLRAEGGLPTVKLSPRVRAEPVPGKAIPTISPSAIEPFLAKPLVVGQTELDAAPVISATEENRVAIGAGSIAYATGLAKGQGELWQVFRRGDALLDPDTREILGYQAIYLGEARVLKYGEQSTLEILRSNQEISVGDRLLPAAKEQPVFSYVPRAPQKQVRGRIVSTYGNLGESGPNAIVALSKGARDGLEVGHVLAIYRSQSTARYELRTSPLYGRQGPSGSDEPRVYYSEQITPRDAPIHARGAPVRQQDIATLPDERYGLVMVFRTFDRAAFALIMQASRPVALYDVVTNP